MKSPGDVAGEPLRGFTDVEKHCVRAKEGRRLLWIDTSVLLRPPRQPTHDDLPYHQVPHGVCFYMEYTPWGTSCMQYRAEGRP